MSVSETRLAAAAKSQDGVLRETLLMNNPERPPERHTPPCINVFVAHVPTFVRGRPCRTNCPSAAARQVGWGRRREESGVAVGLVRARNEESVMQKMYIYIYDNNEIRR